MRKNPNADGATSLLAVHHPAMLKMARRIIDMNSQWTRILLRQKRSQEEFESYTPNDDNKDRPPPSPIVYEKNTMRFGRVLEETLAEVNVARKYQTDVVKLLNLKPGTTGKISCFPITPYNEISHKGMKMTYSAIMEALQFVEVDNNGRYIALPNAKRRKFHIRCNGLSSQSFPCLPINLIRQISQIDSAPLIDTLKNSTAFLDYFYETRMHRQDCIYWSKYACLLQPFQVHLSWKRINGEPTKRNMRSHEIFLIFIYESMRIHRCCCEKDSLQNLWEEE